MIKKVYLITPNIPEAEILTKKNQSINDMIEAAKILIKFGVKNVLIKGGHKKSKFIEDVLFTKGKIKFIKVKK